MDPANFSRTILDNFDMNIVLLDNSGNILNYNNKWIDFAVDNGNPDLINSEIGSNYLEVTKRAIFEDEDDTANLAYNGLLDLIEGNRDRFELEYPCHSPEEKRWFLMHASRCKGQDNIVIYHENITEKKLAQLELRSSKEKYRKLAESTDAILWEYDVLADEWTYIAPQVETILGYTPDEWSGLDFWAEHIHPDDRDWAVNYCNECTGKGEAHKFEYRFLKKDGSTVWIHDVVNVEMDNGTPSKLRGFMIDITERKRLEELEKKKLLFKEVHHRVKNNLQVIMSLLNMQARKFEDEDVKNSFRESQARVKAMLLAHKKLYESHHLGSIEMSDYISALVKDIIDAYKAQDMKINLDLDIDEIELSMDETVPLSLILNELVTNSLKHAFPNRSEGSISIIFKDCGTNYKLTVSDDGIGMSQEKFDSNNTDSLGLNLVDMLVLQLNGNLQINGSQGTVYTIEFEKEYV